MSNIYLLSTCDEWKSSSSMSCIMATTSLDKLRKGIIQKIKDEDIEYKRGYDDITVKEQLAMFKSDWERDKTFACDNLDYGYVETMENGVLDCWHTY